MTDNNQPMTLEGAQEYAVNQIAEFCTGLRRQGIPPALILYALDVNHGMCLKVTLDQSFAALEAESSEGPQGG